jgi:hypothetical protein
LDYVFTRWTHFDKLALWSYAHNVTQNDFGQFDNLSSVKTFMGEDEWVIQQLSNYFNNIHKFNTSTFQSTDGPNLCNTFIALSKLNATNLNIILLSTGFFSDEVKPACENAIDLSYFKINHDFYIFVFRH